MADLDGWTEHLVVPFAKRPTNAQGSSGFLLIRSKSRHSQPPDDCNHMPKHVEVENLERINKNIHCYLERFLVFLQTKKQ
jgi:hypothetical protein